MFLLNQLTNRTKQKRVTFVTMIDQSIIIEFITNDDSKERVFKKFRIDINFELNNDFIYYIDEKTRRLCLFTTTKKNFV